MTALIGVALAVLGLVVAAVAIAGFAIWSSANVNTVGKRESNGG